jgi:hypothetical protein
MSQTHEQIAAKHAQDARNAVWKYFGMNPLHVASRADVRKYIESAILAALREAQQGAPAPAAPPTAGLSDVELRCEAQKYETEARAALSDLESSRDPHRQRRSEFIWQYHEWMPIARRIAAAARASSTAPARRSDEIVLQVAKNYLAMLNRERESPDSWPAGQKWGDLAGSSQATCIRHAKELLKGTGIAAEGAAQEKLD